MCTPRNFVSVLYGITLSSYKTCGRAGFLFCVVWNDIAIVLPAFTTRLFQANHVSIFCLGYPLILVCSCHPQIVQYWDPGHLMVSHLCIIKIIMGQELSPVARRVQFPLWLRQMFLDSCS